MLFTSTRNVICSVRARGGIKMKKYIIRIVVAIGLVSITALHVSGGEQNTGTATFQVGNSKKITTKTELKAVDGQMAVEFKPESENQPFFMGLHRNAASILPYPGMFDKLFVKVENDGRALIKGVVLRATDREPFIPLDEIKPIVSSNRDIFIDFEDGWVEVRSKEPLAVPFNPFSGAIDFGQGLTNGLKNARVIWFSGSTKTTIVDPSNGQAIEEIEYTFLQNACVFWHKEKNRMEWANIRLSRKPLLR